MKPVVIIGAVAAGMSAASELKRRMPDLQVVVYGREPYISYGACGMPYLLSGEVKGPERLQVLSVQDAREKRGIDLYTEHEVTALDPKKKTITVHNLVSGQRHDTEYEKLVLATGARAFKPPMKGLDLPGVFTLKEFQDGLDVQRFMLGKKPSRAVILGGGYIGIETAEAFRQRGMEVTVVEALPRILTLLDEDFSALLEEELARQNVKLLTGKKVTSFFGSGKLEGVELEDGTRLEADIALVSAGVLPNSGLAEEAGLNLGEKKAVLVDRFLKTSDPDIYAAGDCATVYHRGLDRDVFIPLALGANRQGRMCGENIAAELMGEEPKAFPGILGTAVSRVFDLEFSKTGIGSVEVERYGLDTIDVAAVKAKNLAGYFTGTTPMHLKLYYDRDTGVVKGGQIVGGHPSAKRIDTIAVAVAAGMTLEEVYSLDLAYAPPFSPVWDPMLLAARSGMKK
ncbi:MAG: FAD-dependent oxidoreductase [Spirochaetales bacterium]|nr:FAD-dependent oxidoreductase [Spirochaetales bacterium]